MARRRYPGINSFTRNDEDIFCGRKEDVKNLLTRLMISNTLVMYGESGNGKSSVVQAGLLPEIGRHNKLLESKSKLPYHAIIIRMDEINQENEKDKKAVSKNLIIEYILGLLRTDQPANDIALPLLKVHPDLLWYYAKQLEKKGYSLLLVFDQFEELQSFSEDQIKVLSEQLADLFVNTVPEKLYEEYLAATKEISLENITEVKRSEYSENIRFLEQHLSARLFFVVREDKLGTMSLLRDNFPDILKNDYILNPLNEKNARNAIAEPCKKNGDFESLPFTIEEPAQDKLIEMLRNKTNKKGFFDPFELQVVCRAIEQEVIDTKKTSITEADLPKVENAVRDYYDHIWDLTKKNQNLDDNSLMRIKRKMIAALVINRKRNMVLEDSIADNETEKSVFKELIKEGLIKPIPSGNQHFYQLRHDRLIIPLMEDLQDLESQEKVQKEVQKVVQKQVQIRVREVESTIVISHLGLRKLIGVILLLLPFLVVIGKLISENSLQLEYSISDYYDNGIAGDMLVGILFVLGFLLLTYRGYDVIDSRAAGLGCVAALGVAIFPANIADRGTYSHYLHLIFFYLLFLVLIFFSMFLFTKTGGGKHLTWQKKHRNRIYLNSGIIMIGCLIGITACNFFFIELSSRYHIVFWLESLLFYAAGFSWLTKGEVFFKDMKDYKRPEAKESFLSMVDEFLIMIQALLRRISTNIVNLFQARAKKKP